MYCCGSRDGDWRPAWVRRSPWQRCLRPGTRHSSTPASASLLTAFLPLLLLLLLFFSAPFHCSSPPPPCRPRPPPFRHLSRPVLGGGHGPGPGKGLGPAQTGHHVALCLCASPLDHQNGYCPLTNFHPLLSLRLGQPLHSRRSLLPPLSLSRKSGKTSPAADATVSEQQRTRNINFWPWTSHVIINIQMKIVVKRTQFCSCSTVCTILHLQLCHQNTDFRINLRSKKHVVFFIFLHILHVFVVSHVAKLSSWNSEKLSNNSYFKLNNIDQRKWWLMFVVELICPYGRTALILFLISHQPACLPVAIWAAFSLPASALAWNTPAEWSCAAAAAGAVFSCSPCKPHRRWPHRPVNPESSGGKKDSRFDCGCGCGCGCGCPLCGRYCCCCCCCCSRSRGCFLGCGHRRWAGPAGSDSCHGWCFPRGHAWREDARPSACPSRRRRAIGAGRECGSWGSMEVVAVQRRWRRVEVEEEAQETGNQMGCHVRSCCRRPQPGFLSLHWTELHSPVMEDTRID